MKRSSLSKQLRVVNAGTQKSSRILLVVRQRDHFLFLTRERILIKHDTKKQTE